MLPSPTAVVLALVALVVVIVAYKGTQANFIAAAIGHAPAGTGQTGTGQGPAAGNSASGARHGGVSPGDILPFVGGIVPGVLLSTTPGPATGSVGYV